MRLGDNFESIQVALKMIPNLEQNDFLLRRMTLVGGNETQYTGRESDIDYDEKSMGEEDDYHHFFEWSGTETDDFPKLRFDEEHVPLGNSVNYCLGLSWTTLKKRNQYDKYLDVRGQEMCNQYAAKRSQWEQDYPTHGLNFPIWKQSITKDDNSCYGGIYVASSSNCYRYEVMS